MDRYTTVTLLGEGPRGQTYLCDDKYVVDLLTDATMVRALDGICGMSRTKIVEHGTDVTFVESEVPDGPYVSGDLDGDLRRMFVLTIVPVLKEIDARGLELTCFDRRNIIVNENKQVCMIDIGGHVGYKKTDDGRCTVVNMIRLIDSMMDMRDPILRDLLANNPPMTLNEMFAHEYFDLNIELNNNPWSSHSSSSSSSSMEEEEDNSFDFMTDYTIIGRMGPEPYDNVLDVISLDGIRRVAKIVKKYGVDEPREVEIMRALNDVPNVARVVAVYDIGSGRIGTYKTDKRPCFVIVMERPADPFVTFYEWTKMNDVTIGKKRTVLTRMVTILRHLNEKNMAHNDLHENNVLVNTRTMDVTLIDFDRAEYKDRAFGEVDTLINWEGSPPELRYRKMFSYDLLTVWRIGRMMYRALCPRRSFPSDMHDVDYEGLPSDAIDLLKKIFVRAERRITLDELFNHPFFFFNGGGSYDKMAECGNDEERRQFLHDYTIVGLHAPHVLQVIDNVTHRPFAAKIIEKEDIEWIDGVPLEVKIMMDLKEVDGVSQFRAYYDLGSHFSIPHYATDDPCVVVVMTKPKKQYTLLPARITDKSRLKHIFSQIVDILARIDQKNIAHMAIHRNNILVDIDDTVMIIDFCRAQYKNRPFRYVDDYAQWGPAAPPELLHRKMFDYDQQTIWSIGYLLFTTGSPIDDPLLADVMRQTIVPLEKRCTLQQLFDHPYFH